MDHNKQNDNSNGFKLKGNHLLIAVGFLILYLIFAIVAFILRVLILPEGNSFSEWLQDFYNLSSPLIAFIGAILVFYSFKVQYDANERQRVELEKQKQRMDQDRAYQICYDLYRSIIEDVQNFNIFIPEQNGANGIKKTQYYGYDAIWHFRNRIRNVDFDSLESKVENLTYIVDEILSLRAKIESSKLNDFDLDFLKENCLMSVIGLYHKPFNVIRNKLKGRSEYYLDSPVYNTVENYHFSIQILNLYYANELKKGVRKEESSPQPSSDDN